MISQTRDAAVKLGYGLCERSRVSTRSQENVVDHLPLHMGRPYILARGSTVITCHNHHLPVDITLHLSLTRPQSQILACIDHPYLTSSILPTKKKTLALTLSNLLDALSPLRVLHRQRIRSSGRQRSKALTSSSTSPTRHLARPTGL